MTNETTLADKLKELTIEQLTESGCSAIREIINRRGDVPTDRLLSESSGAFRSLTDYQLNTLAVYCAKEAARRGC